MTVDTCRTMTEFILKMTLSQPTVSLIIGKYRRCHNDAGKSLRKILDAQMSTLTAEKLASSNTVPLHVRKLAVPPDAEVRGLALW